MVVLAGETGVGKTRLVSAVRELAERDGVTMAAGGCLEPFATQPYAPVAELLRDLLRGRDAADARALLERASSRGCFACFRSWAGRRRMARRSRSTSATAWRAASARCSSAAPPSSRLWSCSKTCTGPTPPRSSCCRGSLVACAAAPCSCSRRCAPMSWPRAPTCWRRSPSSSASAWPSGSRSRRWSRTRSRRWSGRSRRCLARAARRGPPAQRRQPAVRGGAGANPRRRVRRGAADHPGGDPAPRRPAPRRRAGAAERRFGCRRAVRARAGAADRRARRGGGPGRRAGGARAGARPRGAAAAASGSAMR